MKKLVLAGCLMFGASFARADVALDFVREAVRDTGTYFFSVLTIGYYDHFHGSHDGEVSKEKNLLLAAPVLAFRKVGVESFGTFDGSEVKEWGFRFDTRINAVKNWLRIEPYFFKNEDADAMGFGIVAQIKIR